MRATLRLLFTTIPTVAVGLGLVTLLHRLTGWTADFIALPTIAILVIGWWELEPRILPAMRGARRESEVLWKLYLQMGAGALIMWAGFLAEDITTPGNHLFWRVLSILGILLFIPAAARFHEWQKAERASGGPDERFRQNYDWAVKIAHLAGLLLAGLGGVLAAPENLDIRGDVLAMIIFAGMVLSGLFTAAWLDWRDGRAVAGRA